MVDRWFRCTEQLVSRIFNVIQVDLLFLLCSFLILQCLFELFDFVLQLLIVLLLNNKLLHEHLPLVLLRLEVALKRSILLYQRSVLIVNPLCNVRNQLKMMPQFVFSLLLFGSLVSTLGLFFLYRFLCSRNHALELPGQLLGLLFLQLVQLVVVVVDVFIDIVEVPRIGNLVRLGRSRHQPLSDPEFSVQKVNLLSILLFVLVVTLCTTNNLSFGFLVLVILLFDRQFQLEVLIEPLIVLDVCLLPRFLRSLVHDVVEGNRRLVRELLLLNGAWAKLHGGESG